MDKITTTIKREWLSQIANKTKRVEYRELKPYWTERLSKHKAPFLLRLINGMKKKAPELTVTVTQVIKNSRSGNYELRLGRIIEMKHWNVKLGRPSHR